MFCHSDIFFAVIRCTHIHKFYGSEVIDLLLPFGQSSIVVIEVMSRSKNLGSLVMHLYCFSLISSIILLGDEPGIKIMGKPVCVFV